MGTVTLRWVESHLMVASDTNGQSVVVGCLPETDNPWVGVKPADLLLMAVASCSTWDIIEILQKQRQPLQDLKTTCTGEQQDHPPFAFTKIHVHYAVSGLVDPEKIERAIRLSEKKYCSVMATLRPGVPISSSYEVLTPIIPSPV